MKFSKSHNDPTDKSRNKIYLNYKLLAEVPGVVRENGQQINRSNLSILSHTDVPIGGGDRG